MKVKSIKVTNYKAVEEQELELNGASVIVTAGNNKGKTSILRGLVDRFRGEKPEIIVKEGEEKGINTMELTDGSKIEWKFTKKTENFSFTTPDDIKMTTGVLSAIGEKYFGIKFDIDKFMSSSKAEALKMVQKLVGLDFSVLNAKYKVIFDERTGVNRDLKNLKANKLEKPVEVTVVDIEALKLEKQGLVNKNTALKEKWIIDNEAHQKDATDFNKEQDSRNNAIVHLSNGKDILNQFQGSAVGSFIDFKGLEKLLNELPKAEENKEVTTLVEPEYHSLIDIEKSIEDAYEDKSKSDAYAKALEDYNKWVKNGKETTAKSEELSKKLEDINAEKLELVKKSSLPDEFEMVEEGLLYKGLPLDDNQISSSAKYICALKLGSLVLGKLRTMHFDCSFLDKNSLKEIQDWAEENDLQLLIERPDWDGGSIKYQIIEESE